MSSAQHGAIAEQREARERARRVGLLEAVPSIDEPPEEESPEEEEPIAA